jgi:hypothetical protein
MASAQDTFELSRHFLADRDGYAVVLKVFMDESGTHDGSPIVAVGAYLSRPKIWRSWTKEWNKAKRPIKVFHATDCAGFFNEFKGWDKERRDPYVANLLPVLPRHDLAGIVVGIDLNVFRAEVVKHPELREMFGEPYGACFQWAISIIMEYATGHGKGERMAFVHETNNYQAEALKAFNFVNENLNPRGIPMTLAFGAKSDYVPLQAADVLAYEGAKFLRNPTGTLRRAWVALDPDKSRIQALRYGPDNMGTLISTLKSYRARLLAQGWDGKLTA